jgi:hypothetical protein
MIQYLAATQCNHPFLFFPNWWKYLPTQPKPPSCNITFSFPNDIWAIALVALDILLRVGGFVAVISIIIAGVQYITSSGNPENASNARKRLTNSLIGLGIVLIASGAVDFIGNTFGGK